jgi:protein involved in polysaccharide export with SLBB domain
MSRLIIKDDSEHYFLKVLHPAFRCGTLLKFFLFFMFLVSVSNYSQAQTTEDLSNVRVEELTDEQIRKFVAEADRLLLKDEQIEQLAFNNGMNQVELIKLKDRIKSIRKALTAPANTTPKNPSNTSLTGSGAEAINGPEQKPTEDFKTIFAELKSKNFGFEVFNNKKLTFEPNLRLPTPKNYRLAADDELLIDISGYSEMSYRLKVSPEGIIRIPVAGPVTVSGLTIEQAKTAITRKLSQTIYTNIRTGKTSVEVNLGTIRSMKVTVIGEATLPGTYTLPSLASAYNALYACGGPNLNGSFRNIQVIRNNNIIATIDVYQYLLNGSKKNDIRLMDEDVIKINTYGVRIELKGEIKKPGFYDVAEGEKMDEIVNYAGGFTDNAYTARIQVFKNTSKERQVTTIEENNLPNITPQKGDSYIVGKILNRFSNRISIKGAVYRPGEYELKEGMTLTQLIKEADGLREDAFTSRATLHRLKDDLSPEIVSFDIEKLLGGKIKDVTLKREDRITIFSKFDLKEGYYVTIEGEVSSPGIFLYEDSITVEDLILMAGGLKEAASTKRIEISRRLKNADKDSANTKTAVIYQKDIELNLQDSAGIPAFTLLPFDEVTIRQAPGYFTQKNVVIEGEIKYTGKYTLEAKNDRISDLIKRAGGLTKEAYLKGAVLVRTKNLSKSEQNNNEQGLANLLKQNYTAGVSPVLLQNELDLNFRKKSENVGIDLETILDDPQSEYDLFLNDGDTLRIPRQLQTVRVSGEVLYPALVRFDEDFKFKDYINKAGGFSDRSSKKRPYVVYANGTVKGTKSFLFFKNYPRLSPGAEIFVPTKREKERLRSVEIVSLGVSLATMLAILYNVIKK